MEYSTSISIVISISTVSPSHIVNLIIFTPTGFEGFGADTKIWSSTSINGCFNVKSAYDSIFDLYQPTDPQWKKI